MVNATLTRLEGVNEILRAVGSRPVNSLDPPSPPDALRAIAKIDDVTRRVNDEGWDLNQEDEVTLTPDGSGEILVPANVVRLNWNEQHRVNRNIVVRRRKLYDATNHTFVFTSPVKVRVVYLIDFEDMDYSHQRYIVTLASLELSDEAIGDPARRNALLSQHVAARVGVLRNETEGGDYNLLDPVARTLRRRLPR